MTQHHTHLKGWPGDRIPGSADVEFAHRPLDATIVASVKHSLRDTLHGRQIYQYLREDGNNSLQNAEKQPQLLMWPSCVVSSVLTSELESQVAGIDVSKLVSVCRDQFLESAPFLRDLIDKSTFEQPKAAYVRYAMASIGGLVAAEPASRCVALWRSAIRLITWHLETDNREARKIDLISAWIFMETFGYLTSDARTWKHTSMAHGYVEAAVWRLVGDPGQFVPDQVQDRPTTSTTKWQSACPLTAGVSPTRPRGLVAYILMIDLLRSIHYGQSATLMTSTSLVDFTQEEDDLTNGDKRVRTESLRTLLAILARIHAVAVVLWPLVGFQTKFKHGAFGERPPSVAFSGAAEVEQLGIELNQDLVAWKDMWFESVDRSVVVLFHFCRLYHSFPELQDLICISGYSPRAKARGSQEYAAQVTRVMNGIRKDANAVTYAWDTLSALDDSHSSPLASVWIPTVLFYASLVVWASVTANATQQSQGSLKVLEIFQNKLESIGMPCCEEMSRVLGELMTRPLDSSGILHITA